MDKLSVESLDLTLVQSDGITNRTVPVILEEVNLSRLGAFIHKDSGS